MIRWTLVRGKRIPAALPPNPLPFASILSGYLREIESLYLEAFAGLGRTDAVKRREGDRVSIVSMLRDTDRSRDTIREHTLSVLVDGFESFSPPGALVDATGRAIIRGANSGFDALVSAQGGAKKVKASIFAIDHRAKNSDMERFLGRFRKDNTSLIRKLIAEHVARTEQVLAENYGEHVDVLSERIREATGTSERHAVLLARDQTLKVNADVQAFRAKSVGAEWYTWITSNDERVRGKPGGKWANAQSNHYALHGKKFRYSDPPITNAKKGIRLNPGRDFQCRCTATPDLSHIFED